MPPVAGSANPAVLQGHVRRMLLDARAGALVNSFALQWLKVGKVAGVVPDVDAFPEFDENLRRAMLEETQVFLADQLARDRPVPELVTADYSFLNDRLARHYGVAGVYGSHFRRVAFADGVRGGLLGQASVLTATSYPNRTSPVLRGRWLLDTVLGSPPPPPPPDVPTLEQASAGRVLNQREQLEAHRKNPACATCHVRMDPLGFSLEQFDALGQWRVATSAGPIDATATLPDGSRFDGARGLRAFLAGHRDDFVRTFTEKLLAYALGRGLEPADMPAVRGIVRAAAPGQYRWSSIVVGIVQSVPFRMASASAAARDATAGRRVAAVIRKGSSMIVLRKSIPRRTVLRGLGASLALPLLDGMIPALTARGQTAAAPVHRFGVVYVPNGMVMENYLPATEGAVVRADPDAAGAGAVPIADDGAERAQLRAVPRPPGRGTRQGLHALPHRHLAAHERNLARRRHLDGSDPRQRAREGDATGVARAGDRKQRHRRRLRRRLRLRLHQHDLVAQRQHAAADAAQPARGVRAAVRRRRQHRRAGPAGAAASAAQRARLGARRKSPA